MNRFLICSVFLTTNIFLGTAAHAQSVSKKPTSPGEIAAASERLAETYDACRRQAKEQKLSFVKRRIFIHKCVKR